LGRSLFLLDGLFNWPFKKHISLAESSMAGCEEMNKLARTSDPATSHDAANKALSFKSSHAKRILAVLRVYGPMASCQMEVVGLSVVQADRRLYELERARLIVVATSENGNEIRVNGCRVWRLV
jgi:hypothetical protein